MSKSIRQKGSIQTANTHLEWKKEGFGMLRSSKFKMVHARGRIVLLELRDLDLQHRHTRNLSPPTRNQACSDGLDTFLQCRKRPPHLVSQCSPRPLGRYLPRRRGIEYIHHLGTRHISIYCIELARVDTQLSRSV